MKYRFIKIIDEESKEGKTLDFSKLPDKDIRYLAAGDFTISEADRKSIKFANSFLDKKGIVLKESEKAYLVKFPILQWNKERTEKITVYVKLWFPKKWHFYTFKDAKDLNYVYKNGLVYKDKDGKLKRKSYYEIEDYYENKYLGKGKFTKAQIYYMIQQADSDCDSYIELHKNDVEVEPFKPRKYKDMSKEEYINYLINSGYSDVDAEEKADALYGEDDE